MMVYVRLWLLLLLGLMPSACGYHLVGQGDSSVVPDGVETAALSATTDATGKALLAEFQHVWVQHDELPSLQAAKASPKHVNVRIEQAKNTFTPVAFDAAGLAIQYRLTISAVLNMYQENALIWSSGSVVVGANVFGDSATANNPSVVEAERETLTEQLHLRWANETMTRFKSGF